mgnify:CR=1 FL=1
MPPDMSTQIIAKQSLSKSNSLNTFDCMPGKQESTISVRFDEVLLKAINERAARYKVSRANIIRRLIEEGLRAEIKMMPSASSLEKKLDLLSRDMQAMKESMAEYGAREDPKKHKTGSF